MLAESTSGRPFLHNLTEPLALPSPERVTATSRSYYAPLAQQRLSVAMATVYASVNRKGKAQLVSAVNCFALQQHNTAYGRHVSTILLALISAGTMRRDPDLLSQAHLGEFGKGRQGGSWD